MNREDPFADDDDFDSGNPQPKASNQEKPGGPVLEYEFGDSQGWSQGDAGVIPGVTLMDTQYSSADALGVTLMPEKEPGLLKDFKQAYEDLDTWGVVGAVSATAALVALAPVEGVLGGVFVTGVALKAAYSWTNVAVHAAGGGDVLKPFSGLFSVTGIPVFVREILGGTEQNVALGRANLANQVYTLGTGIQSLRVPKGDRDAAKLLIKLRSIQKNIEDISRYREAQGQTTPSNMCKPGGPVLVKP